VKNRERAIHLLTERVCEGGSVIETVRERL
jgi:hypothetical protein